MLCTTEPPGKAHCHYVFLILAAPIGVKGHVIRLSIYISPVANDVTIFSLYLFAIHIPSVSSCFVLFLIQSFFVFILFYC